ncbi:TIR domain-containing protein [Streptomyces cyaneofuscatus]
MFVIHGRSDRARRGLFEFLRAIGLDPIEWSEAGRMTGKGSPYIGEILDAAFGSAQAVVVLPTPDDVTYLHESLTHPGDPECNPQMQLPLVGQPVSAVWDGGSPLSWQHSGWRSMRRRRLTCWWTICRVARRETKCPT